MTVPSRSRKTAARTSGHRSGPWAEHARSLGARGGERFVGPDVAVVAVPREASHAADEARQHVEAEIESTEVRDLAVGVGTDHVDARDAEDNLGGACTVPLTVDNGDQP